VRLSSAPTLVASPVRLRGHHGSKELGVFSIRDGFAILID
jgi:hypothetical protein